MLRKIFPAILILCLCGCATIYNPATGRKEFIFINESTEIAIGKNVATEITKKENVLEDEKLQERIEKIGKKITAVSDRSNIKYEFHVLDNKELNALSLPGGIIYIYKGMLDKLNNDELAFVIGHEVGHVAAKHAVKTIQANMAFQLVLSIAFAAMGKDTSTATNVARATNTAYNLIALGYSRKDEYLADNLAVKYMYKAHFKPQAAISALEKFKTEEGFRLKILDYFRTHPSLRDRIKLLQETIPQVISPKSDS